MGKIKLRPDSQEPLSPCRRKTKMKRKKGKTKTKVPPRRDLSLTSQELFPRDSSSLPSHSPSLVTDLLPTT